MEQEEAIRVLDEKVHGLTREVAERDAQLGKERQERDTLRDALSKSKEQLTECLKEIESNKQVIDWLQKEVNTAKISQYSGRPGALRPAPGASQPAPASIRPYARYKFIQ